MFVCVFKCFGPHGLTLNNITRSRSKNKDIKKQITSKNTFNGANSCHAGRGLCVLRGVPWSQDTQIHTCMHTQNHNKRQTTSGYHRSLRFLSCSLVLRDTSCLCFYYFLCACQCIFVCVCYLKDYVNPPQQGSAFLSLCLLNGFPREEKKIARNNIWTGIETCFPIAYTYLITLDVSSAPSVGRKWGYFRTKRAYHLIFVPSWLILLFRLLDREVLMCFQDK